MPSPDTVPSMRAFLPDIMGIVYINANSISSSVIPFPQGTGEDEEEEAKRE